MKFDINFEETILSKCIKDQAFLKKAAPLLESHHFGTRQHSWIWKSIKHIWDTYREKPNGKLLIMRAKHDFIKPEDLEIHLKLLKKILKKKTKSAYATLGELETFVRSVNAQKVLEDAATQLEKENVEKVWEILNRASRQDIKPKNYNVVRWIEEFEDRQRERKFRADNPGSVIRVPTGFKTLDNLLGGGLEAGELGLVLGTTGKGKSFVLGNLAFWSAAVGYPTLYITLEMSSQKVAQRLDARWSKYTYNQFKTYDFKPSELRKLKSRTKYALKRFANKLMIVETPVRKTTINDIERILDDLNDDYGFIPKTIVVDSGDHMSSTRRYETYRLEQADVYWHLSWLSQQGHVVWSAVQAGKEYAKKLADAEASSESYDKSRIASLAMSINFPEKESRRTKISTDDDDDEDETEDEIFVVDGKYMELYVSKCRDSEDKVRIPVDAMYAKGYIKEIETDD